MSCNYYRGKCLFLNGKEDGCKGCPIKQAYNKGVRDTKKDDRPKGYWIDIDSLVSKAKCSNCKNIIITEPFGKPKTCPNCSADMRGKTKWIQ